MAMFDPGGAGSEHFGDPAGGGGPIHVRRARAIAGQIVRVVFDNVPLEKSSAGFSDALNPSNYRISILDGGQAVPPLAIAVERNLVVGPQLGVALGEYGADVHFDRAFVVGLSYRVTVSNIISKSGGALGAPYSADFDGVVPLQTTRPPTRKVDLTDFGFDSSTGAFIFTNAGDLSPQGGIQGTKKRILRRLTTLLGGFKFLPDYGLGLELKTPASPSRLQTLRADGTQQVKLEPDVADASLSIELKAAQALFITVRAVTTTGQVINGTVGLSNEGQITIA